MVIQRSLPHLAPGELGWPGLLTHTWPIFNWLPWGSPLTRAKVGGTGHRDFAPLLTFPVSTAGCRQTGPVLSCPFHHLRLFSIHPGDGHCSIHFGDKELQAQRAQAGIGRGGIQSCTQLYSTSRVSLPVSHCLPPSQNSLHGTTQLGNERGSVDQVESWKEHLARGLGNLSSGVDDSGQVPPSHRTQIPMLIHL